MIDESLRKELVDMAEEDRRIRRALAATGELYAGYAPAMEAVHGRNAERLTAILSERGWPGKSLVGEDGARAAWLIVQHAIGDPALQRASLRMIEEAAARGDADPAEAAYLEDRIRFFERRPQRHGTQFDWDEDGRMSVWVLEDPEHVDEYRRAVGLGPLAERLEEVRRETADEAPPVDLASHREAMIEWARRVGWLRPR